jgi:uncharacterized protein
MKKTQKPILGFGLGLRTEHYDTILKENPKVDWFEILSENYLVPGGKPIYFLEQICERYPVVMHGVSMSIGSSDPLDWDYLKQIKNLAEKTKAHWLSDHLCWTGIEGKNLHDLLPLPYTEEAVKHVVKRLKEVQDFLERRILIENVSSYVNYEQSTMSEWEFISAIAEEADSLILLDINNIYVSSVNHEFDPLEYISNVPAERIYQFHLAGHLNMGNYIIDTHDHDIVKPVWKLYEETLKRVGFVSTMIERDDHIPPLNEVIQELEEAKKIAQKICPEECKQLVIPSVVEGSHVASTESNQGDPSATLGMTRVSHA